MRPPGTRLGVATMTVSELQNLLAECDLDCGAWRGILVIGGETDDDHLRGLHLLGLVETKVLRWNDVEYHLSEDGRAALEVLMAGDAPADA